MCVVWCDEHIVAQHTVTELVFSVSVSVGQNEVGVFVHEGKKLKERFIPSWVILVIDCDQNVTLSFRGRAWHVICWRGGFISSRFVVLNETLNTESVHGHSEIKWCVQVMMCSSLSSAGRFFTCPSGWVRYKSGCYLYVSSGRSWSSAAVL